MASSPDQTAHEIDAAAKGGMWNASSKIKPHERDLLAPVDDSPQETSPNVLVDVLDSAPSRHGPSRKRK